MQNSTTAKVQTPTEKHFIESSEKILQFEVFEPYQREGKCLVERPERTNNSC